MTVSDLQQRLSTLPALRRAAGVGLGLTMAVTLAAMLSPALPRGLAIAAYLCTLPLLVPLLRRQHAVFLGICVLLGAALALRGQWSALSRALWQSAGLASLIVSLVLLRVSAAQSPALVRLARDVAAMPRGRRDLGLSLAAQFIGLLLNVGLFGLLAPMIARSGAPELEKRRMALAVLRGFGPTMLWAPTAAAQVVITTVVPGITWAGLAPMTFSMAMALILLGWLFSLAERRLVPGTPPRSRNTRPDRAALVEVAALVAVMFAVIVALHVVLDFPLLVGVMIASLLIFGLWTLLQARRARLPAAGAVLDSARQCIETRFAAGASEIMTLGAAGFMAAAIPPLVPEAWLDAVMLPLSERRVLLYPAISLAIAAFSASGLNPLVAASLIGGAFTAIPPDLTEPYLLAFSLAAGWGVAYGISPFTTGTVVLASMLGTTPNALAWRFNGAFSLVAMSFVLATVLAAVALTAP